MFGKKANENDKPDLELFLMYDSKVESYEKPAWAVNHLDVIRQITNLFGEPGQERNKYLVNAEDYSLFKVASLWLKTGRVETCNPTHIANMHELRAIAMRDKQRAQEQMGIVGT